MSDDFGKLVARLTVSVLLLFHGVHRVLNGIDPIRQMISAHHLPEALSYGVYAGELAGPLLVALGFFSRIGGSLIMLDMLAMVYLARMHDLLALNAQGGYALELEVFFFLGGLCVVLFGAGRFSAGGADGPLN